MPRVLKDINQDTGIAQGKKNKTRNFSAFFVFSLFAHLWFVFLCDSEDPWLDEYFATAGLDEFYRTSSIAVPNIELICSGDDIETKNRDDLINIKILYTEYKDKNCHGCRCKHQSGN